MRVDDDMCPNCVTPWKCNGPHITLPERFAAEREGRLRAEARVRALEEALGEALEASREPHAEKARLALEELHQWALYPGQWVHARARVMDILDRYGVGGGS